MKILAVSGSLRADSYNTQLLRAAAAAAPGGVEVELWEGIGDLPIYDQDVEGDVPERVRRLRRDWAAADAILFATPEYNGSVPGGLKNAVDWASRPKGEAALMNKTVAVVGASMGQFGAMWAQQDLRRILGIAGARVVGEGLPVSRAHEGFDEAVHDGLRRALATLVEAASPVDVAA
ncbi:MAG TPA: NAD(P)H-dependent oxidoreductase [Gaiellaceae bacterium]|nr:NAD(P)H-dependent oxidoreductase [Gaiellaceae bacterium]